MFRSKLAIGIRVQLEIRSALGSSSSGWLAVVYLPSIVCMQHTLDFKPASPQMILPITAILTPVSLPLDFLHPRSLHLRGYTHNKSPGA
jgi:hypothetical protein